MARIRTIKPEFWSDEKLAPLPPITRLTFLGLVSMADDAGRLNDNLKLLDGLLFSETNDTCCEALDELESIGVITRGMAANGRRVIQITNWLKHQKIEKANVRAALPEISTTRRGSVDDASGKRRGNVGEASPTRRGNVDDLSGRRRESLENVRQMILERDQFTCKTCGITVTPQKQDRYDSRDELAEVDVIVRTEDGGDESDPNNLETICRKCKRNKEMREIRQRNRRQVDDESTTHRGSVGEESTTSRGNVGEESPTSRRTIPTTNDQRPTTSSPTPPEPKTGGGGGFEAGKGPTESVVVENLVTALAVRGVGRPREAVEAAIARGVSGDVLWHVIAYWDSANGALQPGALVERIRTAEESQRTEDGWPKHERPGKPKRPKKPPGSDAMAVVREMRKRGRSEAEIDQELRRLGLHEELANA